MIKAWRETVVIPTYEVGAMEKNPIFLEKRVYQGSSGVVYPYPVIESMSDEKKDKEYHAVYLENEYIKVMILPELGGRVQMAYDKIKQRHFVYYNHVIKPALVGLAGPWISGGIEFNWPQHHRPSTYLPVDSTIEENKDGSVTVWVNEMEKMFHQKGMAGFTLRPGCAYLEIKGRLYNRTDVPQTFLWWANPAVAVNDYYQSVFPPDINAVFDHGKRAVSSFPIATGTYYKMDYSSGVDISNYKNISVPTSYMAVNSKFDFEGGYENDTKGGMLHVASHHLSPGKKQWTWGNGDFGKAWDRNLTDEDGPYIELMAGVYTENQPDFSWLMPYEEKRFTQYFMPYRDLGIVKNATRDLIFNIDKDDNGNATFKLLATKKIHVRVSLGNDNGDSYFDKVVELSPDKVMVESVDVKGAELSELCFGVYSKGTVKEHLLLTWHAEPDEVKAIPDAAEAALLPADVKTNEQLYLTGLHLEQYRHATYSPVDYYEEALRRDPMDYRCNNALGLWYLRKGRFDKAERYLRTAVKILMRRNPNPYDGEPIYNLALALKYQGQIDEAYELFWKSTWNKGWADAGYFEAAKLSVMQGRMDDAVDEIDRCLDNNRRNHKARALKAVVMRLMCEDGSDYCTIGSRLQFLKESLALDPFNYGCIYELYLLSGDKQILTDMKTMMRHSSDNYDELALDYVQAGRGDEAAEIWNIAIEENVVTPMTYYYKGDYEKAAVQNGDYCFPNRLEAVIALEKAKVLNPKDAKAPYYLGCLYYDKRQYDVAMENWEMSAKLDATFPTVWRNLALAYFNKKDDKVTALEYMNRAFSLDENDARILMELDQLCRRLQESCDKRLERLNKYPTLVSQRDDLLLEKITLLNETGQYEEAKELLDGHIFHPWEGGEGKVSRQYQISRAEIAKCIIAEKELKEMPRAIKLLQECLVFPHNLSEGKLKNAQDNSFYYFMGCAYLLMNENEKAVACFEEAAKGDLEPVAAMYYNDAKPDEIFYQGMALLKLGKSDKANGQFYKLLNYGKKHLFDNPVMDYFAVSLPDMLIWEDSLDARNQIHCRFMLALGYYGLGDKKHSKRYLDEAKELDSNHQGIQTFESFANHSF